MRILIFFVSLFFVATVTWGQTGTSKLSMYEPVRIINPDQLFSTVFWKPEMKVDLIGKLGESTAENVMMAADEKTWPKSIAGLSIRELNKTKMLDYNCQYLTTLNNGMAVLLVSASENSHMGDGMRPETDFYLVMLTIAFEARDLQTKSNVQVFSKNLNAIIVNFEEQLSNIMGEPLEYIEDDDETIFDCTVPLEGAHYVTLHEVGAEFDISFRAVFLGEIDKPKALVRFQDLVNKVSASELSCCTLVKIQGTTKSNIRSQDFMVIAKDGYSSDYQKLVIKVTFEAFEKFNTEGHTVSVWTPVIYIYNK